VPGASDHLRQLAFAQIAILFFSLFPSPGLLPRGVIARTFLENDARITGSTAYIRVAVFMKERIEPKINGGMSLDQGR
jgi:hypothetical protein